MADLLCPVLIGRDAESGWLRSALGAAQNGMGRMVFLTGEAGIGKSRLASELAAEAQERGATVLAGRAVPTSGSIPYRPLTEALQQALRERTFPDDPGLTPWLLALRAMIPTIADPRGDGHSEHTAPVRGEAVLQLLQRLAGATGLLLVLEDLHWADPDTLAIVEYLSDNLSAESVLCVVTCRSETPSAGAELVARLTGRRAASRLALSRLTASQVAAMVRACLSSAADDVITRVQHVADGESARPHPDREPTRAAAQNRLQSHQDLPELIHLRCPSDTTAVNAWWPDSPTETAVLALERHLNQRRRPSLSVPAARTSRSIPTTYSAPACTRATSSSPWPLYRCTTCGEQPNISRKRSRSVRSRLGLVRAGAYPPQSGSPAVPGARSPRPPWFTGHVPGQGTRRMTTAALP